MLANTLTITVSGVGYTLVRIGEQNGTSLYRLRDDAKEVKLTIRNTEESPSKKANSALPIYRSNVYIEWTRYATMTEPEYYYSTSNTYRYRKGSAPSFLKLLSDGTGTLSTSIKSDVIDGQV